MNEQQTSKQVQKNMEAKASSSYEKFDDLLKSKKSIHEKLEKMPVKLVRTFSKTTGREQVSISLEIHKEHFKELRINNAGEYLTSQLFNLIKLDAGLSLKDEKGRPILEWNVNARGRFIKGKTNNDSEYHAVQIAFSKETFIVSFMQPDDVKLINKLEDLKLIKINWVESPDKINDVKKLPDLIFD